MRKLLIYLGLQKSEGQTFLFRFDTPYAWAALAIALIVASVMRTFVF